MAHHMGGELRGRSAAVREPPKQLRTFSVGGDADDAEVVPRIVLDVLKILARARDEEDPARKGRGVETRRFHAHEGDLADDARRVEILADFVLIEEHTDIAAVSFIPTEAVHVRRRVAEGCEEFCTFDCFHSHFDAINRRSCKVRGCPPR